MDEYGRRRRERLMKESSLSFRKYGLRIGLIAFFLLVDTLMLPTVALATTSNTLELVVALGVSLLVAVYLQKIAVERVR
jgi:hypothetical protein